MVDKLEVTYDNTYNGPYPSQWIYGNFAYSYKHNVQQKSVSIRYVNCENIYKQITVKYDTEHLQKIINQKHQRKHL